jgi:transposase
MKNYTIKHLDPGYFDWLSWKSGSILEIFNIQHRYFSISKNINTIRKYAVGYCKAKELLFRPKQGYIAVMFNHGEIYSWWTHLTEKEFKICFPEINIW